MSSQRILGNDLWTIIDLDSCMNDKSATKQDIPLCCTVQGQHRRHHPLSLSPIYTHSIVSILHLHLQSRWYVIDSGEADSMVLTIYSPPVSNP
jgi:hypothetical protein